MKKSLITHDTGIITQTGKKTPIKRHDALKHFSRDHHFGLLLVWKIREGVKLSETPNA